MMTAPATGFPVEASVTTPRTVPVVCAEATLANSSASGARRRRRSNFFLMTSSQGESTQPQSNGRSLV